MNDHHAANTKLPVGEKARASGQDINETELMLATTDRVVHSSTRTECESIASTRGSITAQRAVSSTLACSHEESLDNIAMKCANRSMPTGDAEDIELSRQRKDQCKPSLSQRRAGRVEEIWGPLAMIHHLPFSAGSDGLSKL